MTGPLDEAVARSRARYLAHDPAEAREVIARHEPELDLAEVWCGRCEAPATGSDVLCDFCRACIEAGLPVPAIRDPWLRRQWLLARGLRPTPYGIELCGDCGHAVDIHDRRGDAADAECGESCDTCIEAEREHQGERQQIEYGRFT